MSTKHAKAAEKFLENPVMAAWHQGKGLHGNESIA